VTIRSVPLEEARDGASIHLILVSENTNIFFAARLDTNSENQLDGQIRKRPPTEAASIVGADFDHFSARLLQYHPTSSFLQPVNSPASVHLAQVL